MQVQSRVSRGPFVAGDIALAALDDARRGVQQAQTGHRGRAGDPLYGIHSTPGVQLANREPQP
jgi:hypothetical protein